MKGFIFTLVLLGAFSSFAREQLVIDGPVENIKDTPNRIQVGLEYENAGIVELRDISLVYTVNDKNGENEKITKLWTLLSELKELSNSICNDLGFIKGARSFKRSVNGHGLSQGENATLVMRDLSYKNYSDRQITGRNYPVYLERVSCKANNAETRKLSVIQN